MRRALATLLAVTLAGLTVTLSTASEAATPYTLVKTGSWLSSLNNLRTAVGVGTVTESSTLSANLEKHMRYMVNSGDFAHEELPTSPYFTIAGTTSGENSVLTASSGSWSSQSAVVNSWLDAPYHLDAMLRPRLATAGFRAVNSSSPLGLGNYGGIDVYGGTQRSATSKVVIWPPSGRLPDFVPLTYKGNEGPEPLQTSGCSFRASYEHPASLPLFIRLPKPALRWSVSLTRVRDGAALIACSIAPAFPDPAFRGIIGRSPFVRGESYRAKWVADGVTYTRNFSIGGTNLWPGQKVATPGAPVVRAAKTTVAPGEPVTLTVTCKAGSVVEIYGRPMGSSTATLLRKGSMPSSGTVTLNVPIKSNTVFSAKGPLGWSLPVEVHVS